MLHTRGKEAPHLSPPSPQPRLVGTTLGSKECVGRSMGNPLVRSCAYYTYTYTNVGFTDIPRVMPIPEQARTIIFGGRD